MDFDFSDEQQALQDMARDFAARELAPHAARWDKDEVFPEATLRRAAELGMAGIYVSEANGGSGLARLEAAILFEELAAGCTSTAAYLSIHNMVAWMVDRFGSAEQQHRFLPDLLGMAHFASYCLTEPDSGSDAASLKTTARPDGDTYRLDGSKAFVSGGGRSDLYLVMARTGGKGAGGISAFLVESDRPGISFGANEKKLGWHSQPTAMVHLDDCRVPAANRLGEEGSGFKLAMAGLDGGRINIAACSLGAAKACLERSFDYVRERRQFGAPLASLQSVQFTLADMATELDAARLLVRRAALALDGAAGAGAGAADATLAAAMAKRFATDVGFSVVDRALQLLGGYGYIEDYAIERYFRDTRVHRILEGTNEIMRLVIARKLLESRR
jgi:alkylation response protein AidB-like acyl-CoA dehydrogenase